MLSSSYFTNIAVILRFFSHDRLLKYMDFMMSVSESMVMRVYGDIVSSALIALDWPP